MKRHLLVCSAVIALAVSTAPAVANSPAGTETKAASAKPKIETWGVDMSAIDKNTKPGDDFFQYVNGAWVARTEIAPDRTSAGVGVDLVDQAERDVRAIVEDLSKTKTKPGTVAQQVGDYYASWMDEAKVEELGTKPLKPYLDYVWAINDKTGLIKAFARNGYMSPAGASPIPDLADPTRYTIAIGQSGLGMPDRDYYLLEGEKYDGYRAAYKQYIVTQLRNAGIADAEAKAEGIFNLEVEIAKTHWTKVESRNIARLNNPKTLEQITELAPQYNWKLFFAEAKIPAMPTYLFANDTAIIGSAKLIDSVPLATWKDYLAFHFISSHASALPKKFDQASFDFFNKTLNGQPEQRARWKRGISLMNGALGEAIGQIYVERHYPPASNAQMNELIANLRAAFETRLAKLDWMDEATRKEALVKLAAFDPRVGHPKKWIDYSSLRIDRGDLLGNIMRSTDFFQDLQLSRVPKPVDRDLWAMTPQTVNAYYNPLANQITFPAAILQAPYFDPNADAAVNYGAIGAVIGHEIGHGFDDQGSKFDATGKFRNWWGPETKAKFDAATGKLAVQYDQFEPLPGLKVNGKLTLGENIGDLGGLQMAYTAYQFYKQKNGEPPVIDGLTGDQRFFLAFGQAWRGKQRDDALRTQVLTDPHSPRVYRVNGTLRNFDEWYKAFDVKPGDKMYLPPEERVRIW
jgi:putative endopeptidase